MTIPHEITTQTGRLTDAPRAGQSPKGTHYVRFRMATETPVTPNDWRGEKRTDFFSVVCFGSTAEHVDLSLSKGDRVIVTGRLEDGTWTGRNGQLHEDQKIIADAVGADLRFVSVDVKRTKPGRES